MCNLLNKKKKAIGQFKLWPGQNKCSIRNTFLFIIIIVLTNINLGFFYFYSLIEAKQINESYTVEAYTDVLKRWGCTLHNKENGGNNRKKIIKEIN